VAIRDILRNNVKEKLERDEVVASMTVRLIRTVEIARIARTAGFDTLYVDIEHSSFSLDACGQICMAALEAGIAPFVRVPANTPDYVSRVLDGGALGVIAPHIRSADEAKAVVSAAKFPPLGERSNAGGLPHLHFRSFPAAEACAALNDATMVVVQFAPRRSTAPRRSWRSTASTWCSSASTTCWRIGAFPESTTIPACARPMPRPSRPAASAESTAASAGSPRVPIWWPSS
jgi:HpcH/HpaI aldolase/citrate lyase family